MIPDTYSVIDANAKSVLLSGPSNGLYRVSLPNGRPSAKPSLLFSIASSTTVGAATEDAKAVYWFQSDGTLDSCLATYCQAQLLSMIKTSSAICIKMTRLSIGQCDHKRWSGDAASK